MFTGDVKARRVSFIVGSYIGATFSVHGHRSDDGWRPITPLSV
jgi:hypothetical protein